jgi:hypothetical protein
VPENIAYAASFFGLCQLGRHFKKTVAGERILNLEHCPKRCARAFQPGPCARQQSRE